MADELKIFIDGDIYRDWERVEIVKDLEAVAGAFNITLDKPSIFNFAPGKSLRLEIANVPVIEGYIEGTAFTGEANTLELIIQGRDKTGDIIDCSAITTSSEFLNVSFLTLAEKLCAPFGIKVINQTDKSKKKIVKVSLQKGSVYEELEREARKVGVFLYPSPDGNLYLSEIGSETLGTRLVCPGNVISFTAKVDYSDRFSEYILKGQQSSGGGGVLTAKQQTQVYAKANDPNIHRYRPLLIVGESNITAAQAKDRVEWEAAVRAGRSEELTLIVDGWTDKDSRLWQLNKLISVKVEELNFESEMLIKSVSFRYNETDGQATAITVSDPNAYLPKPVVPKKVSGGKTSILPKT